MSYHEAFGVEPGSRVRLADFGSRLTDGSGQKKHALREIAKLQQRVDALQI